MKGMPAGGNMATCMGMLTNGPALSSEFGSSLGRGTGEQTGPDRAVPNGRMPGMGAGRMSGMASGAGGRWVPGFRKDMFGMNEYTEPQVKKPTRPQTRALRRACFRQGEGLMPVGLELPPGLH